MQVIQDTNAGGRLGAALGTGLQQLAQNKLAHVMQQHEKAQYAAGLAPVLGKAAATFVSNLAPEERKVALQNPGFLMQLNEELGGGAGSSDQSSGIAALSGPNNPQVPQLSALNFLENPNAVSPLIRQALGNAPVQFNGQEQAPQEQGQGQPQPRPVNNAERAKLLENIFTSPAEKREREKLGLAKEKLQSTKDLAAWKNTQKHREEVLKNEQTSREALSAIKEAQALEKAGDFPSQQFASFLKGAEWEDVPGFLSGSAEAFNKILANFQRGAKDIYGGRITNFEMEQFLKTIPNLQHTPEGRARIWAMMKNYYKGGKEYAKMERQIIKENGGVPPQDLHEQANERFRPISKDLSKKFKADLEEANKLSSSYAERAGSVAAYGAGKLASSIPGALKGAAKGAATGALTGTYLLPGLGTTTGALIGGGLGALSGGAGGGGGLSDILKLLL